MLKTNCTNIVLFQSELQDNCLKKLDDLLYTLNRVLSELLAADGERIAEWKSLVEYQKRQTDIERTVIMHSRMVNMLLCLFVCTEMLCS